MIKNPVAKKRLLRFKSMKRAYFSLWIIVILYALSLISELVCNNIPLYIHYNDRSYFPVFKYYSEDEFNHSGRQTRPDYRALNQSIAFASSDKNFMVFPTFPYGPFESIAPESIAIADGATMKFTSEPRIGTIDVGPELNILRQRLDGSFFGKTQLKIKGQKLNTFFSLPANLSDSIDHRFLNKDAPYQQFIIKNKLNEKIEVSLSTFSTRSRPPKKLRLTFKEYHHTDKSSESIHFDRLLNPEFSSPSIWETLKEGDKSILLDKIQNRFQQPVDAYRLLVNGRQFTVFLRRRMSGSLSRR